MASRAALDLFHADGGTRREPRYTLLLCVKLLTARGLLSARLRDLSLSGAMVEGHDLPAPGAAALRQPDPISAFKIPKCDDSDMREGLRRVARVCYLILGRRPETSGKGQ